MITVHPCNPEYAKLIAEGWTDVGPSDVAGLVDLQPPPEDES